MEFSEAYELLGSDIQVISYSQQVPGLERDDVVSEMLVCLWKASQQWVEIAGVPFAAYWWSIWQNRKVDLSRAWSAQKRVNPILSGEPLDQRYEQAHMPMPPSGTTREGRLIWQMLASGATRNDVLDLLSISKRRYYNFVHEWQTVDVHSMLRNTL